MAEAVPAAHSLEDRLRRLQLQPRVSLRRDNRGVTASHQRQCPWCAEGLYHCDLYALPWLMRCPIHHCEFTEVCPRCQRPWPDLKE